MFHKKNLPFARFNNLCIVHGINDVDTWINLSNKTHDTAVTYRPHT